MTRPESKNKLDVDDGKENEEHIAPSVFILKMIKCPKNQNFVTFIVFMIK